MTSPGSGKLKVAFLGGSVTSAAGYAHYSAINIDGKFELVAGCFSRNSEINFQTASAYGISEDRVYSNLELLLENEKGKIDVIIILTPTDQHARQVIKCIENGVPVICEKALACSSSEAEDIIVAQQRNKAFLAVIYNYLGYPMIRELKYIIDSGRIGRVTHIQAEMPQEGFIRKSPDGNPIIPQNWRLKDNLIPKVSLDLGVHLHMMIKYLTGEKPVRVAGVSESLGNFREVTDNVISLIEYTGPMTCNMWFSKMATGCRNGLKIRVYGEKGSAGWVQEEPEHLYLADIFSHRWVMDRGSSEVRICNQPRYTRFKAGHPAGFIEAFANYYADIAKSLHDFKTGTSSVLNTDCYGADESLEGLRLFEAISISSTNKDWEAVKQ